MAAAGSSGHDPRRLARRGLPAVGLIYRLNAFLAFAIFRVQAWRYRVTGLEQVPAVGGAVIAANHTSFWDFFTVGWAPYRRLGRPIRILAKASLFRTPVFGWLMRRSRHIPVERGAGAHAYDAAVEALRRGELVLVLPEQTISPSFDLLPFKTGAVRMAAAAGVPLVPAVSWGTQRFHTAGRRPRWAWRLPVEIRYGPPLHPATDVDPDEATEALRAAIQGLLHDAIEAYPDAATPGDDWWYPARLGGSAPSHGTALAELERRRLARRRREADRDSDAA